MTTLGNKRKFSALNEENCEEFLRRNLPQNSNVPRSQEDYITQVSEENEDRVTKKLSQKFSRTENRILGALSRFDDFLMNPLIQGHSGTTLETSRNAFGTKQGTNEDNSQSHAHPEAGIFHSQTTLNSGPEDGHDLMTRVQKESLCGQDMVTRAQKESLCGHDMVTRVQKESLCGHDKSIFPKFNATLNNHKKLLSDMDSKT